MRITRIYQPINLSENSTLTLDLNASNHILRVLRLKSGAALRIFNGQGGEYKAELIGAEKKHALVKVKNFLDINRESSLNIHLGQGISRGEKMDFIIQKATELGVAKITPLFTEFSNVKLPADRLTKKIAHWRAVAISACEQCGRNQIPEITLPQTLTNWLQQTTDNLKIILNPEAEKNVKDLPQVTDTTILIGPEGGLSDQEIAAAQQNNFMAIKLGPRILRTETAGLAAIAALQFLWGDLNL